MDLRCPKCNSTDLKKVSLAYEEGLFRSADSGATWKKASLGIKDDDDVEAVVASPSGKVFCGLFHGVFFSADGGEKWTPLNDGLMNPDVRALAVGGGSQPRLYAGIAAGSVQSIELP